MKTSGWPKTHMASRTQHKMTCEKLQITKWCDAENDSTTEWPQEDAYSSQKQIFDLTSIFGKEAQFMGQQISQLSIDNKTFEYDESAVAAEADESWGASFKIRVEPLRAATPFLPNIFCMVGDRFTKRSWSRKLSVWFDQNRKQINKWKNQNTSNVVR